MTTKAKTAALAEKLRDDLEDITAVYDGKNWHFVSGEHKVHYANCIATEGGFISLDEEAGVLEFEWSDEPGGSRMGRVVITLDAIKVWRTGYAW